MPSPRFAAVAHAAGFRCSLGWRPLRHSVFEVRDQVVEWNHCALVVSGFPIVRDVAQKHEHECTCIYIYTHTLFTVGYSEQPRILPFRRGHWPASCASSWCNFLRKLCLALLSFFFRYVKGLCCGIVQSISRCLHAS